MQIHNEHPRNFKTYKYVYPVISRRSKGLSLGINLNPDGKCTYNCVYCQVPEHEKTATDQVDLSILKTELKTVVEQIISDEIFTFEPFCHIQDTEKRVFRDIAIAGNGEPTIIPCLPEVMDIIGNLSTEIKLPQTVLITNASGLHLEKTRTALTTLADLNGCIWAKLDAGSPEFHKIVNRSNVSLERIIKNIADLPTEISLFIQTCWFNWNGKPPTNTEILLYKEKLIQILNKRPVTGIQIYTVARQPRESQVSPITINRLQEMALPLKELPLNIEFYG
jgi:wyosine [tRNA(Phe)-imidazoG37] synthetase (radical SAM superfamily)